MPAFYVMLFKTATHQPVYTFIQSLHEQTTSKILRIFNLIETYGMVIGMPYVKQIDRSLYEVRIRGKEEIRFLATVIENNIIVLHGFRKKRRKIASKDIETAKNRLTMI